MTDSITILTHSNGRLCKRWLLDGTISAYDETKNYTVRTREVTDIRDLSFELLQLEGESRSAVIRGVPNDYVDPDAAPGRRRKIKAAYDDAPHHWVLIDIDDFTPMFDPIADPETCIDEFVQGYLPPEFTGVSYHWQLSNSAGKTPGILKAHVWFWLKEARDSNSLRAWAPVGIDESIFNSVQFHFTAAPLFEAGVADPVPRRSGFVEGMFGDEVDVAITPAARASAMVVLDDNDAWLMSLQPTAGATDEELAKLLTCLPDDLAYDDWIKVGMAVHHESGGNGFDIWHAWSKQSPKYTTEEHARERWNSFGRGTGRVTMALLKSLVKDNELQLRYTATEAWKTKIKACGAEFDLRERLCPEIQKDTLLGDMEREALAQVLLATFRGLGTKYPLAQVRKLIAAPRVAREGQGGVPEWAAGWVWVTDDDKFYRKDSDEWLTRTSFDARFNRLQSRNEEGTIVATASAVALDDIGIKTVTRAVYLPWGGPEFVMDGVDCINKYRPSSVPLAVDKLSGRGRAAVALIERHLAFICDGRQEVVTQLMSWLAHNVQQPGVKVRWAPLIRGVEGDGKSILSSVLIAAMGRPQVKSVSPKVLATDFSGWAEGACVAALEELKMTGHNRHDVLNALKPYITNGSVEIHRKGRDPYEGVNTTNYIGFTNFSDALPLSDTDRRWFIVFTPWHTKVEMGQIIGRDPNDYFDELVEVIKTQPAEIRRWFLDYEIPATFKPNGNAPDTAEKAEMVGLSVSEDDDTVQDVIDQGGEGVGPDVLSSPCLTRALAFANLESKMQTTSINRLLTRLGWRKLPAKLKWRGASHRVWVKGQIPADSETLRAALEKTLEKLVSDMPGSEI